jgi:hypothetical protein
VTSKSNSKNNWVSKKICAEITPYRNAAQLKYSELSHEIDSFQRKCKDDEVSPDSKYDALIVKQSCANETIMKKIKESREKLADLTLNLKSMQVCGKGNEPDRLTAQCTYNLSIKIIFLQIAI